MHYRLDELSGLADELGLPTKRVSPDHLEVTVQEGCVLAFSNLENDTLVGFEGTPWHSHGILTFMTGEGKHIECDELDVLIGLGSGELLVISSFENGEVEDRWIAHKLEGLELRYIAPGEELRVFRLPEREEIKRRAT